MCLRFRSLFCSLLRGKPSPRFELVAPAIPIVAQLLQSPDSEVLSDGCWALSYLSDGENDRIQGVLNSGVSPRLVELLSHSAASVVTPALRTVGNLVTGDDTQTQVRGLCFCSHPPWADIESGSPLAIFFVLCPSPLAFFVCFNRLIACLAFLACIGLSRLC